VGKSEGKRPLETSRLKLEDNIKMDLRGLRLSYMVRIDLAQGREWWRALVNTGMNICTTGDFSRRVQLHEVS
jgi:hypothetical protein